MQILSNHKQPNQKTKTKKLHAAHEKPKSYYKFEPISHGHGFNYSITRANIPLDVLSVASSEHSP